MIYEVNVSTYITHKMMHRKRSYKAKVIKPIDPFQDCTDTSEDDTLRTGKRKIVVHVPRNRNNDNSSNDEESNNLSQVSRVYAYDSLVRISPKNCVIVIDPDHESKCLIYNLTVHIDDVVTNLFGANLNKHFLQASKTECDEIWGRVLPSKAAFQYIKQIDIVKMVFTNMLKSFDDLQQIFDELFLYFKRDLGSNQLSFSQVFNLNLWMQQHEVLNNSQDQLLRIVAYVILLLYSNYEDEIILNNDEELFLFLSLVLIRDDKIAAIVSQHMRQLKLFSKWYGKILDTSSFVYNCLYHFMTLGREDAVQVNMRAYLLKCK